MDSHVTLDDGWENYALFSFRLSGTSPFYHEDEKDVVKCVQSVKWSFEDADFSSVSSHAKDFIKQALKRAPE